MNAPDAAAFADCLAAGGVAVFPADTVYGLACDPENAEAVERLYALKGRRPDKPAAVMFFALGRALASLPGLSPRLRGALDRLLPGALTVLLPNAEHRFPLACVGDPETLGIRVPRLDGPIAALAPVRAPVLQSSANASGGPDPRRVDDIPETIRAGADLLLDAGELPGTPSTVVDLRRFEQGARWTVVRAGAVDAADLVAALGKPGEAA